MLCTHKKKTERKKERKRETAHNKGSSVKFAAQQSNSAVPGSNKEDRTIKAKHFFHVYLFFFKKQTKNKTKKPAT